MSRDPHDTQHALTALAGAADHDGGVPPGGARHIVIAAQDFNRGGTERVALTLAGHWAALGRRVNMLVGAVAGGLEDTVPPGVTVVECSPPVPRSLLARLRLGRAMAEPLRALSPDVVFLTGNYHFILAPALRRAVPGTPIIAKVSNPLLSGVPRVVEALLALAVRQVTRAIDLLVFMAPELAEEGRRLLPGRAMATVAEPNLPAGWQPPPRGTAEDPPLVLAIGRLEPQKHMALALRTFAELRRQRPARLVVLGEGPERPTLEALARRLGIAGDVDMPGFADPAPYLARASALLMSSRYEGYPAVVVEALAADVPVVSTPCTPALASLIASPLHGAVTPADPAALARALAATLDQPFVSDGARAASVAHHDARRSAQEYLALFDAAQQGALQAAPRPA
ncbi:MAG: glycosyltransferase [Proteobacteria bacterium]|nr:glycosyltransferase [Pseudomonadota bacterium]